MRCTCGVCPVCRNRKTRRAWYESQIPKIRQKRRQERARKGEGPSDAELDRRALEWLERQKTA